MLTTLRRVGAISGAAVVAVAGALVTTSPAHADEYDDRETLAVGWAVRELDNDDGWLIDNGGISRDLVRTVDLATTLHRLDREPAAVQSVLTDLRAEARDLDLLIYNATVPGGSARTWNSVNVVAARLFLARVAPGSSVVDRVDLDRYLPAMVDPRNGQLRDVRADGSPFAGGRATASPDSQAELVGALRAAGLTAKARQAEGFLRLQQCPDGSFRTFSTGTRCTRSAGARPGPVVEVTARVVLGLRGATLTDATKRTAARAKDYLRRAQDRFGVGPGAGVVAQAVGGRHARTAAQVLREQQLVREVGPDCPSAEVNRGLVPDRAGLGDRCFELERDDIENWHDAHTGAVPVLAVRPGR